MTGGVPVDTGRWFRWGSPLLSATILAVAGLCGYWAVIDRAPPVTVHGGELEGYERQANGSLVLFVHWYGERHRTCPGVSRRWLADGAVLPLPDIAYPPQSEDEPPGPVEWRVAVEVPGYLVTSGHRRFAYRIHIDYACNPLQEVAFPIRVVPPPVEFEVLPDGAVVSARRN